MDTGTSHDDAPDDPGPSTDTSEEPSPYVQDDPEPEPLLSLEEVATGIEEAISYLQHIDPALLHEVYEAARAHDDEECPYYDEDYYDTYDRYYWRDSCTTDDGSTFTGYGYSYDYAPFIDDDGTYDYDHYSYFYGSAQIVDPNGNTFSGSGYSSFYERTYITYNYRYSYNYMYGNYRWDGPGYEDTWLAEDLNISVYVSAVEYTDYPGITISIEASISGIDGPINTVVLDGVYIYSEVLGSLCEIEPGGSFAVRDSEGNWYEALFHGPAYSGADAFPPDCDSCGPVFFRGEPIGEVCPDFSGLWNWEARPW